MVSLPQTTAFDLCGEQPRSIGPRRTHAEVVTALEDRSRHVLADQLARIVEGDIIPRLMLVHKSDKVVGEETICLGPETTERFALYTLSSEQDSLLAIVGMLLQQGISLEGIYLDLLAPAARRLGEFWNEDRVSFADVTIGLGRLQRVVRELSLNNSSDPAFSSHGRSALFAPAPGEQHTFGLVIIEEFFRRAGWRTWSELSGSLQEVLSAVQTHQFDLFGMTASSDDRLDQIPPMVMSIRRASRNRDITIMVGGRLFLERPELVAQVGADAMAVDARQAVLGAEGALRRLARG